jgi:hypothetical protein
VEREVDQSPPSNAEVRNAWSYICFPLNNFMVFGKNLPPPVWLRAAIHKDRHQPFS